MDNAQHSLALGHLRSGSKVLAQHIVSMTENPVGNRMAVFAQSGFGKTNAIKIMLWGAMGENHGKLIFDRRGEYVPDTTNEREEVVPGLAHHPHAKEKLVLLTSRKSQLENASVKDKLHALKQFTVKLEDIPPADLMALYPSMTNPQREFLYLYEGDPTQSSFSVYKDVMAKDSQRWDESDWNRTLSDWFGNKDATQKLEYSAAIVVRSIRKKLVTMQNRPFVSQEGNGINEIFEHLRSGRTVVVDLSGYVSERDRTFVATLITRKLFNYNLQRLDTPKGDRIKGKISTVIYFEEAQTLLSTDHINEGSIFVDVAKEGRALDIGLVAITQQPSAISTNILSQFNTFLALHLEFTDDIAFLKKVAGNFDGLEMDLRRKVPGHAYFVTRLRPFAVPLKVFHFDRTFIDSKAASSMET